MTSLNRYGRAQGAHEPPRLGDVGRRRPVSRAGTSARSARRADGSDDYRNELNSFGYIVEIDPYDKTAASRSAPRSAASPTRAPPSARRSRASRWPSTWATTRAASTSTSSSPAPTGTRPTPAPANRIATGDKYLDAGKLYVAKFNADGTGEWIELTIANAAIAAYADLRLRRPGRRAGQRAPRRRCGRRDEDGPPRMVRRAPRHRRGLLHADQQQQPQGRARSGVATGASMPPTRAPTPTRSTAAHRRAGNVNGHIIRIARSRRRGGAPPPSPGTSTCSAPQADADPAQVNLSA